MNMEFEDLIRIRAYEIWQSEGCANGRELEHWTQAAKEVAEFAAAAAPVKTKAAAKNPTNNAAKPRVTRNPAQSKTRKSTRSVQVTLN